MLPSQQGYSWAKSSDPAKVASSNSRQRWHHLMEPKQPRRVSKSGAEISDTIASVEGEATLRLLADPKLYAEFQERVKKHRPATNLATHELLKQFLAEKKYCDEKKTKVEKNTGPDASRETQLPPRTVPGRLGNFLSRNQERQNIQRASAASAGDGSLPSLEEVGEKNRMQRRDSVGVVSMGSSSSVSTRSTSASTGTYASSASDNSSFEVSLSGLIQPTSWFSGLRSE